LFTSHVPGTGETTTIRELTEGDAVECFVSPGDVVYQLPVKRPIIPANFPVKWLMTQEN
jgi:hypothetical protein